MLRFFISLLVFFSVTMTFSQSEPIDLNPKDTLEHKQSYGLRLGIDLSRPIISFVNDDYTGFEIIADYRLTKNLYVAAEIGNEQKTKQEDLFNFTTAGNYLKIGVNKNNYVNWFGEQNLIYMGGRLGLSTFENTLNNYQYFNTNRYWSADGFANSNTEPEKFSGLSASWLEFVFGSQVELFSNIYMGASIRLGFILNQKENKRFPNLFIPGFNKVTDNSRFGVGFNYSISYFLPLYKKKNKAVQNEGIKEGEVN